MRRFLSAVALAFLLQAAGPDRASAQSFWIEESWTRDYTSARSCTVRDLVYGILCAESVIHGPLSISGDSSVVDPPFPAPPTPTFRVHSEWKYGINLYTTGGAFVRFEGLNKICDGSGRPSVYGYGPPGHPNQILMYDPLFSTHCTETSTDSEHTHTTVTDTLGLWMTWATTEACDERMRDGDYCANSTYTQEYLGSVWSFHYAFRVFRAPLWQEFPRLLDLSVHYGKLVQVVPDPEISDPPDNRVDLVADRQALLTVKVSAQDAESTDTRPVTVRLIVDGEAGPILPWGSGPTFPINALRSPGIDVDFVFTPKTTGPQNLTVIVEPRSDVQESTTSNNTQLIPVEVVRTPALNVGYTPLVGYPYGRPTDDEFWQTYFKGVEFTNSTFPVASSKGTRGTAIPLPGSFLGGDAGMREDAVNVGLWAKRHKWVDAPKGHKLAVGVVPDGYFLHHDFVMRDPTTGKPILDSAGNKIPATGVAYCTTDWGVLVQAGRWTAPAHELGHVAGLRCGKGNDEYMTVPPKGNLVGAPGGDPAMPFFVFDGNNRLEISGRYCFMGTTTRETLDTRWIDGADYAALFRYFRSVAADPEILVVSAILWKDGRVDLRPWFHMEAGDPAVSIEGNYRIRVLNANGSVVSELTLPVDFAVQIEPFGAQPTDAVPLVTAVAFPSDAVRVEILRDGQTLAVVDPVGKLLRDAVTAVPEEAFVADRVNQKKALVQKVEAFEQMVAKGDIGPALNKLQNDVRVHVEMWLVNEYAVANALQVTKEELLQLINTLVARLQSRL
jgi:hypothetical protein